ncbi:hypothetical protein KPL70_021934 [Citrus sinensis]|nr:hypothetical protein KPL70_021934 [Citrus sinensis]
MPPKKKDKDKVVLKDTESQATSKESLSTPSKEKLLSSAIPIKSWIEMVEEHEAQYKAIIFEDQVKEWMNSITKSPELMLALQNIFQTQEKEKLVSKAISKPSSSKEIVSCESSFWQIIVSQSKLSQKSSNWLNKAYQQNVLTMDDGFYHSDPFQAISKIFPKGWFFKPWDLSKPKSFYQGILEFTESVKFKHFFLSEAHSEPVYSTATILKVLSPNQWGDQLHKPKTFPANFQRRLNYCLSFSYWDYQQAWFNTFFIQNPKKYHSWLFFFNSKITVQSLPNWFQIWWNYFGPSPDILTQNAIKCLNLFKAHYVPSESEKMFPPFLCFCTNFFLPWVWMWNFQYHTIDTQLVLQRTFKVKWWSKFDEQSKLSKATVQSWLFTRGLIAPSKDIVKAQSTFLAQRVKAQSLLASAKTEDEYFKVMQQLLATRSETSAASSSSSSSGEAEPFISLGNENEDDCFGIFSPLKH